MLQIEATAVRKKRFVKYVIYICQRKQTRAKLTMSLGLSFTYQREAMGEDVPYSSKHIVSQNGQNELQGEGKILFLAFEK